MAEDERELENAERLATLETQMKQLNDNFSILNEKIDVWNESYVPRNELNAMLESRDKEIKSLRDKQVQDEENKWSVRRLWPAWLGVAVAFSQWIKDILEEVISNG